VATIVNRKAENQKNMLCGFFVSAPFTATVVAVNGMHEQILDKF
jgi:hypothetical protein